MQELELQKKGAVYQLMLTNGDAGNVFGEGTFQQYFDVLDELEAVKENCCLVIRSEHPKHWCNGINLEHIKANGMERLHASGFFTDMENLYHRIANLNMPVIAEISGNCYAGGAILACAADFRFMRSDRGRFCFSEVDVKIAFSPRMMQIIRLLPNVQSLNRLALTGEAITGEQALAMQVVDQAYAEQELREKTREYAEFLATKDRATYAEIKRSLRKPVLGVS